jgi:hypothetical protein
MSKTMKILMSSLEPYYESRGTPTSIYQRLAVLSSFGHDIDLLTRHIEIYVDIKKFNFHRIPHLNFIKRVVIESS